MMAELRDLRQKLAQIEARLSDLAESEGLSLEEVVKEFDLVIGEFTSPYHEKPRLYIHLED